MSPNVPQLVLFDIAGTLIVDTSRTMDAYAVVLEGEGLPLDPAWIGEHIGCAKRHVFERILVRHGRSPDRAGDLAGLFAEAIEAGFRSRPPEVFPSVAPVFRALRSNGVGIGLISGFDAGTIECIRSLAGWTPDVIVGSDEVDAGRPAPDLVFESMRRADVRSVRAVATVGDTPRDLLMGHAAECGWSIAVCSGSCGREELECHPHTRVLDTLGDIPPVLGLKEADGDT